MFTDRGFRRPGPSLRGALLCLIPLTLAVQIAGAISGREVGLLYEQNCAGCHGKNLEGGQTESMLDDQWKHGADDESIARLIRDGFEANGMPAWKGLLSDGEIRALVVFIREKGNEYRTGKTAFARPTGDEVVTSREHTFRVLDVVPGGLKTPWSVAFLPDGRMLISELPGSLRVADKTGLLPEPVRGTPPVRAIGQGGLMDVAVHPQYAQNGWIYLSFSDPAPEPALKDVALTAIVRGRLKGMEWTDQEVVFRAPYALYRPGGVHFGCRLVFDNAGHLFFSIGERGHMKDAQDLSRPNGKVHRVFDDGRIPADNPFVNSSNAFPSIWSYGNRNPQGLDLHPQTGDLWEVEHGPRGGDELNLIRKGRNYGWPIISYGMNYDGTPITSLTAREGLEQPVIHWTPSIAVCSMAFYTGDKFPRWRNDLLVTALARQELVRVRLEGERVSEQEVLFKDVGRIRDVVSGPDGFIYVVLNSPDKVVKLSP